MMIDSAGLSPTQIIIASAHWPKIPSPARSRPDAIRNTNANNSVVIDVIAV